MANDRQISPFVHPPYPPPMPSGLLNQGHMERPPICSIPMQKPAQIGDLLPPPVFMRPVHRQPMLMPHPPPMQRPMQPVLPPGKCCNRFKLPACNNFSQNYQISLF